MEFKNVTNMLAEEVEIEHELIITDKVLGDKRIKWREGNAKERAAAEAHFNQRKAEGWLAYKYSKKITDGEVIHEFDARAPKIAMMPPMQGG